MSSAWEPTKDQQIAFHMAEFTALKAEIAEQVKAAAANFQYALIASGGVIAWLSTKDKPTSPTLVELAWWVPVILSVFFGALSLVTMFRLGFTGTYILELEKRLAVNGHGWETYFRTRSRLFGLLYVIAWVVLIGGTLWLALRGPR
jgi:hypothetical protein